jgi:hypothetical protein
MRLEARPDRILFLELRRTYKWMENQVMDLPEECSFDTVDFSPQSPVK